MLSTWGAIGLCALVAAVTAAVSFFVISRKVCRKTSYMLDALEDGETNFKFNERSLRDLNVNRTLNRLRGIFLKEKEAIKEQEEYLSKMMENITTGIVVWDGDGAVRYCNNVALKMLGVSSLSSIRQLRNIGDGIDRAFLQVTPEREGRITVENERGGRTLSVACTRAVLSGKEVNITALNDISGQMDEYEFSSWEKLLRVLTHEIMNTVSPIASLSEALLEDETDPDRKKGLQTISSSSRDLIKFVRTYRNLTGLSLPMKRAFELKELIDSVIGLTKADFEATGASCRYVGRSEDILLYADYGQISQIFINLLKNALQAGAQNVVIEAGIDANDITVVDVCNDGHPISESSRKDIFVPFFTTKKEGSGIGLSLSRQIMRMHGGSITLLGSDLSGTTFRLTFR